MLYSEQMKQICEKLGVNPAECKDGLYSTLLQTICDACDGGGSGGGGGGAVVGDEVNVADFVTDTIKSYSDSRTIGVAAEAFLDFKSLESVNIPNAISIGSNAFKGCNSLKTVTVNRSAQITLGSSAFAGCSALQNIDFLGAINSVGDNCFADCTSFTVVDFKRIPMSFGFNCFGGCKSLTAVIIREQKSTLISTATSTTFANTPIAEGLGYIYVPSKDLSTYKSASGWSTYASQFRVLQDYTVDGTLSGELDETKI